MKMWKTIGICCLFGVACMYAKSTGDANDLRHYVPSTVSSGWHKVYASFPDPAKALVMPDANDTQAWQKLHRLVEAEKVPQQNETVRKLGVRVNPRKYGGVDTLFFTPSKPISDNKIIVYTHGGAYTMLSAYSTQAGAAMIAKETQLCVISVDYTNPPKAKWQQVTDEVISVLRALNEEGCRMQDIAMIGDSAGGALAAGTVLKLRDKGLPLPAALVLWSPWADITQTGDTYRTLAAAEPRFIYERVLGPSADAYADRKDQKHPYVSPVYGDFTKPYPPTLIQGGTREIFLSNFVRLYQALERGGKQVKLDLYEGMPHVFQATLPDAPESQAALHKSAAFIYRALGIKLEANKQNTQEKK